MKQNFYNFNFDENGICHLQPHVFILELSTMFCLVIFRDNSEQCVKFYFPRLSALNYFIEYYSLSHSFNFWRKLLKRFPMYSFEQCRKIVSSYHKYQMWL